MFKGIDQIIVNDDVTLRIIGSGIAVDDGQLIASEIADKGSGRVDDQGSAADDQKIGGGDGTYSTLNDIFIQPFFIEDDIRLDRCAAFVAFGYTAAVEDVIQIKEFVTAAAVVS